MDSFRSPESSNIVGAEWEEQHNMLTIEFVGGTRYRYYGFNKEAWDSFKEAPSKGGHFAEFIRTFGYPFSKEQKGQ